MPARCSLAGDDRRIIFLVENPPDGGVDVALFPLRGEEEVRMQTADPVRAQGTPPVPAIAGGPAEEETGRVIALEGELGRFRIVQGPVGEDKCFDGRIPVIDKIRRTEMEAGLVVSAAFDGLEGPDLGRGIHLR